MVEACNEPMPGSRVGSQHIPIIDTKELCEREAGFYGVVQDAFLLSRQASQSTTGERS